MGDDIPGYSEGATATVYPDSTSAETVSENLKFYYGADDVHNLRRSTETVMIGSARKSMTCIHYDQQNPAASNRVRCLWPTSGKIELALTASNTAGPNHDAMEQLRTFAAALSLK